MKFTQAFVLFVMLSVFIAPISVSGKNADTTGSKPTVTVYKSNIESNESLSFGFMIPPGVQKKELRFVCPKLVTTGLMTYPCGKWIDASVFPMSVSFINKSKAAKKVKIYYRIQNGNRVVNARPATVTVKPAQTNVPVSLKNIPQYGAGNSEAYISTSIGAGLQNSSVTSWQLGITCSPGVTLIVPGKTDIPGETLCGKTQTYFSSSYWNINEGITVIRAGATNSTNVSAFVSYSLTAYDVNAKVIGFAKDNVVLSARN